MIRNLSYGRCIFKSVGYAENDHKYTYNIGYIFGDGGEQDASAVGKLKVLNFRNRVYELYIDNCYTPLSELVEPINLILSNGFDGVKRT